MKRFIFGALLFAALIALVGTPAFAQNIRADLVGFQETPAVSSSATGKFTGKINKDSSIDYTLTYSGLEADATASHIHFGQPGQRQFHVSGCGFGAPGLSSVVIFVL